MPWQQLIVDILALPGVVVVVVPAILVGRFGLDPLQLWTNPLVRLACWGVGAILIVAGLVVATRAGAVLVRLGEGSIGPWHPTHRLVDVGIYDRVRNPMLLGIFSILLGEALVLASPAVFVWFVLFVAGNLVYVPLVEEPALRRRFGATYDLYCQRVPRWLPRLRRP